MPSILDVLDRGVHRAAGAHVALAFGPVGRVGAHACSACLRPGPSSRTQLEAGLLARPPTMNDRRSDSMPRVASKAFTLM